MVNIFNQIQEDEICNDCGLELKYCEICNKNHHKEFFNSEHREEVQ